MSEELDRRFMAAAIRLGASASGTTWPNPAVGAILVRDGVVVGRGCTAAGGRPHAEAAAIADAGARARGATLYVSLEPCAHRSARGGPCADAIVAAGVVRVVAALADPDPRTAGKGFQRLRDAGVEVAVGVMQSEARYALAGHLRRKGEGRPHVLLKLAVSADDAVGRVGERQVAVTGETARLHVQALRAHFDAILVGCGTVEADDPQLSVRLPGLEHRSPLRVILGGDRPIECGLRVFGDGAPTWLLSASGGDGGEVGVPVRRIGLPRQPDGRLSLPAFLRRLSSEGIGRLLVEGGARVARSLLEADLADEIILFRSSGALGGAIVPALAGLPLSTIEASPRYVRMERRRFGADTMSRYVRAD